MKRMHGIFILLWATFLIFTVGCHTLAEINEATPINRAWRLHRRGNYKLAMTNFEAVLKRNPQNGAAYMGLAMTLEDMGDYAKAKEYFAKAVALDPRGKYYYDVGSTQIESPDIRRGWRYYRYGEFSEAITSFNFALEKNPQSAEAYIGLAMTWDDKPGKDYDKAIEYFSKAIEIEPKSGYFWLRGDVWRRKGDFERAIEDYTNAIHKDPGFAGAYTDRGACYISMGKYETALADYEKALELVPSNDQRPYAIQVRTVALGAISDLQKKLRKT